jgi:hypothetical protein
VILCRRQRRLQREHVRIGSAWADPRPCRRIGRRRMVASHVPMGVDGGPMVVLRMVVIAVHVNVQQRQRAIAGQHRDTGERSNPPVHASRVYCILHHGQAEPESLVPATRSRLKA